MSLFIEKPKPVRRSWLGGPLIQCHLPIEDARVKYVCDVCERPALTGVRIAKSGAHMGKWLCASCEAGRMRKPLSIPA